MSLLHLGPSLPLLSSAAMIDQGARSGGGEDPGPRKAARSRAPSIGGGGADAEAEVRRVAGAAALLHHAAGAAGVEAAPRRTGSRARVDYRAMEDGGSDEDAAALGGAEDDDAADGQGGGADDDEDAPAAAVLLLSAATGEGAGASGSLVGRYRPRTSSQGSRHGSADDEEYEEASESKAGRSAGSKRKWKQAAYPHGAARVAAPGAGRPAPPLYAEEAGAVSSGGGEEAVVAATVPRE